MNIHQLNAISHHYKEPDVPFQIYFWGKIQGHYTHPLHKHSYFECCYITNGSGYYIDNNVRYELHPGDCFLSKPDVWHQIEGSSEGGIGLIWVAFELTEERPSDELVTGYRYLLKSDLVMVPAETPSTTAALWRTLQDTGNSEAVNPQLLKYISFSLILSIFHLFQKGNNQEKKALVKPRESILLSQARLYINDNISIKIKFEDLAKHLHVSERQLSRLFKDELGESFSDYYRKVKIQMAAVYLGTAGVSLKTIAELTGFYSIHHFTKAYKDATGFTPGQWRNMKQNQ